jgi:tRNA modification GTPase
MNIENSLDETIVAVATTLGIGSISIIRVSGSNALAVAKHITQRENFTPRYATLSNLYSQDSTLIDQAIVIYFKAPLSFTGEEIVEFQCHGGQAVANILLDEIIKHDVRVANPGEFSKRAYLNGKIDLSQAEAISALINTTSTNGAKLLARQLNGELQTFVDEIRDELIFSLACSEVSIDYAEDDIPQDTLDDVIDRLNKTLSKLTTTLNGSKNRDGLLDGYKIAIVGKPNVGKSSLLNRLLNYERAIVSNIAGTTRDSVEESIKVGSHLVKVIDTAGIRDASDEVERIGIARSKQSIDSADIIIALFDSSAPYSDEDLEIVRLVESSNKYSLIVLNKSDLESKFDRSIFDRSSVEISCNGDISSLVDDLVSYLDQNSQEDQTMLVSKRQIRSVESTIEGIEVAKDLILAGDLELFSYHINESISSISSITKPYEYDEMLDKMFGNFCLGK